MKIAPIVCYFVACGLILLAATLSYGVTEQQGSLVCGGIMLVTIGTIMALCKR